MDNIALIKQLKENLNTLRPGARGETIGEIIRESVRTINRLKTEDTNLNLRLKKIAADLLDIYTKQIQFSDLKNKSENPGLKVKPEFDVSFFESLDILKADLSTALEKL